jgi:tripartite-type tricarboxylate transporter receptor subunit TctC
MTTQRRTFLRIAAGAIALLALPYNARAQTYPARPITIVVPYLAGGSVDIAARTVGQRMSVTLGQTITIENVAGGGSTIGTGRVARAAPDGYTLLVHQNAIAVNVTAYPKLPFNGERDLTGVGLINYSPLILVARNSLRANSLSELVASMKRTDEQVKFAVASGIGSMTHLHTIVFETSVGVHFDLVPYRGVPPALSDILAGHVDVIWLPPEVVVEQIRAGTIKGLAVTSHDRLAVIPSVPSVGEMGYDNLEVRLWQGLFAPADTPMVIIRRLSEALQIALSDPQVQKQYANVGSTVYPKVDQTPEAATALFRNEIKHWGGIIRANKIELSQ